MQKHEFAAGFQPADLPILSVAPQAGKFFGLCSADWLNAKRTVA